MKIKMDKKHQITITCENDMEQVELFWDILAVNEFMKENTPNLKVDLLHVIKLQLKEEQK